MNDSKICIDYTALAQFRRELRKFLAFSEKAAADAGLTPQQHQALLAIRGLSKAAELGVGELADILLLRHHSVVELVDRLEKLDCVERTVDPTDGRRVLVRLTATGDKKLSALSSSHSRELAVMGPELTRLLKQFNTSEGLLPQ